MEARIRSSTSTAGHRPSIATIPGRFQPFAATPSRCCWGSNMHTYNILPTAARKVGQTVCLLAAIAFGLNACNDVLEVKNPGAIGEGQLGDAALAQLIVNGAIGEFQYAYTQYAQWSGVLADEVFTDHTNVDVRDFSEH